MKTLRIMLMWAVLLMPVLTSCEQEDPSIELDGATTVDMAATGGSQTVSLTTNYDWEASSADPWIQVSPASGKKGYASVTIRVDANDTGKARKGSVTLTCQTLRKSITVNQQANLTQTLLIKHSNASFRIPSVSGSGVTGTINWGDGAEEAYASSRTHSYSSAGSYTVTLRLNGGSSFDLASLAGVSEIDVTAF